MFPHSRVTTEGLIELGMPKGCNYAASPSVIMFEQTEFIEASESLQGSSLHEIAFGPISRHEC